MLATAEHTSHYGEQMVYESEWTENIPTGISWLNLLTAQSIPEETDAAECSSTPLRTRGESDCSSSSAESCYVVLEIQRPRSTDAAPSKADVIENEADEDEEEEEMMEEEIEELNFAQPNQDGHRVEYDQSAIVMNIDVGLPATLLCE